MSTIYRVTKTKVTGQRKWILSTVKGFGRVYFVPNPFTGKDWLADEGFYQRTGSRGPIRKPNHKRMPRWRSLGAFKTQAAAEHALHRKIT